MLKEIIAHRGFWTRPDEKNSPIAFRRALSNGFGIETDIRDQQSKLVISHDIPGDQNLISLADFFDMYREINHPGTLALNIKSDGLQDEVSRLVREYQINNYFCFDMSIPDMLGYTKKGLTVYSRVSDIEPVACLSERCSGIWLDSFGDDAWIPTSEFVSTDIEGKVICVVSSELHKRDKSALWKQLKQITDLSRVMLCTDFPDDARDYFYAKN